MKRPTRCSLLLPAIQVPISAALSIWTSRVDWMLVDHSTRVPGRFAGIHLLVIQLNRIWHGLNGPALPGVIGGLGPIAEAIYLFGIAVMWWTIGRSIDRRRGLLEYPPRGREAFFAAGVLIWGLLLLFVGGWEAYLAFAWGTILNPVALSAFVLQTLWGIALITIACLKAARLSAGHPALTREAKSS